MSQTAWEKLQVLAAELGATVTRKKKLLSSARQVVVTSPKEKEWHSGFHKHDQDIALAEVYLLGVQKWKQLRDLAELEKDGESLGYLQKCKVQHGAMLRRQNRDGSELRHNPNRDPSSMAMLHAQLNDSGPTHHHHTSPSSDYDSPSSGSDSSSSTPSGD